MNYIIYFLYKAKAKIVLLNNNIQFLFYKNTVFFIQSVPKVYLGFLDGIVLYKCIRNTTEKWAYYDLDKVYLTRYKNVLVDAYSSYEFSYTYLSSLLHSFWWKFNINSRGNVKYCHQFLQSKMTDFYQEVQTILVLFSPCLLHKSYSIYQNQNRDIGFISLAIWSWRYVLSYLFMWYEIQKYFPIHCISQCDIVRNFVDVTCIYTKNDYSFYFTSIFWTRHKKIKFRFWYPVRFVYDITTFSIVDYFCSYYNFCPFFFLWDLFNQCYQIYF
jgi:hypothetical protein